MSNENCIFCKIIKKQIPAAIIYEDDNTVVFLDANPANPGHCLAVPKEHYENIYEVPEGILKQTIAIVKRIAVAVRKGVNADGMNIGQNNGRCAGQVVNHLHFHVIPRFENDGLGTWPRKQYQQGQAENIKKQIVKYL